MLKVMIVDDEPVAVRRLAALLREFDDLSVVATAGNAATAMELVKRHLPDLLLLDIEMPGLSGIGLADKLRQMADPPAIVFVTAFGRFALEAFDLAVTDYLVKPVVPERLGEAIARARSVRRGRDASIRIEELEQLVERLRRFERDVDGEHPVIWLPDRGASNRVALSDLLWVAAERDYIRLHVTDRSYLLRGRIGEFATKFQKYGMLRVHRSALVRIGAVTRVERLGDRSFRLVFGNGASIDAGRRFASVVKASLHRAEAGRRR